MQIFRNLICLLGIFIFLSSSALAYTETYTENWEISSFHSEINLQENFEATIKEEINADFTNEGHRGILRAIPYSYRIGLNETYEINLNFLSATNENGRPWETDVYRMDGYLNIEATIANNQIIYKPATFIFEYTAQNVIIPFLTSNEFSWNVNSTDVPVPTKNLSATITLPENLTEESLEFICFTGAYGLKGTDCEWEQTGNTVTFTATRDLAPYEGLTVAIKFPITFSTIILRVLKTFWALFLPIIVFFIMLYLWIKKGRDDKTLKTTIIPHYQAPEGLSPTETGTLIDEKLDPRDITATIIDFAIRGYIRINEIEKKRLLGSTTDYELELIKPYETKKEFERLIMEAIFSTNKTGEKVKISSLQNSFPRHIKKIRKSVMTQMVNDGFFPRNPHSVRETYTGIGGVIVFITVWLSEILSIITILGIVISGGIVAIFGRNMPKKTEKGTETYYKLRGLYEYINTAEKDRMKFQEENNIIFEKLLPYAMSFGLIKKWTKAFDGLIKNPPDWYSPAHSWTDRPFTMLYFADRLGSVASRMTTSVGYPGGKGGGAWSGISSFGGGGFSGGGFGGGRIRGL